MACIKLIPLKHLLPENSKLFDKYITTAEKYKLITGRDEVYKGSISIGCL